MSNALLAQTIYQAAQALPISAGKLAVSGTLVANSWVKTDTIFSLCATQVVKVLGCVAEAQRSYCVQHFCASLSQDRP